MISPTKRLNSSILPTNGTLTGTTTLDQSGPGSTGNERAFHFPLILTIRWFSVIPKIFVDRVLLLFRGTHNEFYCFGRLCNMSILI